MMATSDKSMRCPKRRQLRIRCALAGVQKVDIDLPSQKVVVTGDVSQDAVLQTVAKSGKKTELWPQ